MTDIAAPEIPGSGTPTRTHGSRASATSRSSTASSGSSRFRGRVHVPVPDGGIYSLFLVGVAVGGPAYIWLTFIPSSGCSSSRSCSGSSRATTRCRRPLPVQQVLSRACLRLVRRLVLRHRPPRHRRGSRHRCRPVHHESPHNWFGTNWDPTNHTTILLITLVLRDPDHAQHHGSQGHGPCRPIRRRRRDHRDVRDRDHPRDPRLPPRTRLPLHHTGAAHASTNVYGVGFGEAGRRRAGRVLAPVYIFYGFESAGDIAEETKDAGRKIPSRCAGH